MFIIYYIYIIYLFIILHFFSFVLNKFLELVNILNCCLRTISFDASLLCFVCFQYVILLSRCRSEVTTNASHSR